MKKGNPTQVLIGAVGIFSTLIAFFVLIADVSNFSAGTKDVWTKITVVIMTIILMSVVWSLFGVSSGKGSEIYKDLFKRYIDTYSHLDAYSVSELKRILTVNTADVIQATSKSRRGELKTDDLTQIVVDAINSKVLSPTVAAEVLSEFGYLVYVKPDGTFGVVKSKEVENVKPISRPRVKANRVAQLIAEFAEQFELPHNVNLDARSVEIGVKLKDETLPVLFNIDKSDESYAFGAVIGSIDEQHLKDYSREILYRKHIRGITETIDEKGRYIVVGDREGLDGLTDKELKRAVADDLGRIVLARDKFKAVQGSNS